jgi:hypothetical protein
MSSDNLNIECIGEETTDSPKLSPPSTTTTTLPPDSTTTTMKFSLRQPPSLLQTMADEEYWRKRKAAFISSGRDCDDGDGDDGGDGDDDENDDLADGADLDADAGTGNEGNNDDEKVHLNDEDHDLPSQRPAPAPLQQYRLIHFAGRPLPIKRYGSCVECGLDETDEDIVLCDGPGCDLEFHLQCCHPPLRRVPDGDFYCFDCCPFGATKSLQAYLDQVENQREHYYCDLRHDVHFSQSNTGYRKGGSGGGHKSTTISVADDIYVSVVKGVEELAEARIHKTKNASKTTLHSQSESSPPVDAKRSRGRPAKDMTPKEAKLVRPATRPYKNLSFVDHLLIRDMVLQYPARFVKGGRKNLVTPAPPSTVSKKPTLTKSTLLLPSTSLNLSRKTLRVPRSEIQDWYGTVDDLSDLIGMPLKLYCPIDDQYHTGRILIAQRPIPAVYDDVDEFNSQNSHNKSDKKGTKQPIIPTDIECLVRFGSGKDYRKTTLTQWIRLEEHSVLVASQCLWGRMDQPDPVVPSTKNATSEDQPLKVGFPTDPSGDKTKAPGTSPLNSNDGGNARWMRGMLWIRTSRELVNVMDHMNETLGQIEFRTLQNRRGYGFIYDDVPSHNPSTTNKRKWGLVGFWEYPDSKLLEISSDTLQEDSKTLLGSHAGPLSRINMPHMPLSRQGRVALALEKAEFEEKARVKRWVLGLPIENPWLFSSVSNDEHYKGELTRVPDAPKSESYGIDPTPLVRVGVDRLYVLDRYIPFLEGDTDDKRKVTKDLALSLTCTLGCATTVNIQALNKKHQERLA